MSYAAFLFLQLTPHVLLAAVGVGLFKRHRTLATALVACGFLVVVISDVANLFASYEVSNVYRSSGALAAAEVTFHGLAWTVARWSGLVGAWVASLGLLWHVFSPRQRSVP